MKTLRYSIVIKTTPREVWETMLDPEIYKQWVNVSWPGSFYEGELKQDSKVKFIGSDGSGTLARLDELKPYHSMRATHVAVLLPGGVEYTSSDIAKGWIGTKETTTLTKNNDGTLLTLELSIHPEWEKMFDDGWPKALQALKGICEEQVLAG